MKTPNNIDLKLVNYKTFAGHDGMRGLNADIVYNGQKIAHAYDDAWGGEMSIEAIGSFDTQEYKDNKALLDQLNAEIAKLPEITAGEGVHQGGKPFTYKHDLAIIVDELASDIDMQKDIKKGVLCKCEAGYQIAGWTVSLPTFLKKYSDGLKDVQKLYDELKSEKKEILNTEYLASIGVTI